MKKKIFFTVIVVISLLTLVCVLGLCACNTKEDVNKQILPLEKVDEYTQEELDEKLIGISREDLLGVWGKPDGHLNGFWGELWQLTSKKGEHITVYYDENGIVEYVLVKDISM